MEFSYLVVIVLLFVIGWLSVGYWFNQLISTNRLQIALALESQVDYSIRELNKIQVEIEQYSNQEEDQQNKSLLNFILKKKQIVQEAYFNSFNRICYYFLYTSIFDDDYRLSYVPMIEVVVKALVGDKRDKDFENILGFYEKYKRL